MGLMFWLDLATGGAPVHPLYFFPIIFAAVRFGLRAGIITAAATIVLYILGRDTSDQNYSVTEIMTLMWFIAVGVVAARMAQDNRRLRYLAMTDDLTGLHNLRSFEVSLREMVNHAGKTAEPLSLLVLDLDRLKQLNDGYGHFAGAEAVRALGHLLAESLPPGAVACRYGGDEFAVAAPGRNGVDAAQWGDQLRLAVQDATPTLLGKTWPAGTLSVSVGVACSHDVLPLNGGDSNLGEKLFHAADEALYCAKAAGRNCVVTWSRDTRLHSPCLAMSAKRHLS
jgi:diguanylate cyclase (GGDEF)-like protein